MIILWISLFNAKMCCERSDSNDTFAPSHVPGRSWRHVTKFVQITSALLYLIRSWKTIFDHAVLMVKFITNTEINLDMISHINSICSCSFIISTTYVGSESICLINLPYPLSSRLLPDWTTATVYYIWPSKYSH